MIFIESFEFADKVNGYLSDENYGELQFYLVNHPESGDVIRGGGGLRKLRWATGTKGKRGGYRVIYFFHIEGENILMVDIYSKNEQEDLTREQLSYFKDLIKQYQKEYRGSR